MERPSGFMEFIGAPMLMTFLVVCYNPEAHQFKY